MADTYKIEDQTPRSARTAAGGFYDVMRVTFATKPSGIVGTVDVPISAYSTDEVDRLVRAQAALLEAVQAL